MAAVYAGRGLPQRALTYYELALALYRERRDQEGERRARLKLVQVYKTLGQWRDAEEQLRQAIAFDEAIGSPDLEEDRRELAQIEARARPL